MNPYSPEKLDPKAKIDDHVLVDEGPVEGLGVTWRKYRCAGCGLDFWHDNAGGPLYAEARAYGACRG